jgi:F0F1-type ATP synthase assembly protein I
MDRWLPALKLTGIGFYIVTCVVGGTLVGWWLGDKQPLYIVIGLVAGLVIAGYGVYHMLRSLINEQKNQEKGQ